MPGILDQKVVVITGGSRGIGRAISKALAGEGARVIVNYLSSKNEAEETLRMITEAGGTALAFQADVTKKEDVDRMVAETLKTFGTIDGLVNNAAAPIELKKFEELPWEDFHKHFEVQVHGMYNATQAVLPVLKEKKMGVIVNIISGVTLGVVPSGFAGYNTAKFAMLGLTKTLANELKNYHIRVNAVSPGFVETDLTKTLPRLYKEVMISGTTLGRATLPEEVAEVVCSLFAEGPMTGMNLPVGE